MTRKVHEMVSPYLGNTSLTMAELLRLQVDGLRLHILIEAMPAVRSFDAVLPSASVDASRRSARDWLARFPHLVSLLRASRYATAASTLLKLGRLRQRAVPRS